MPFTKAVPSLLTPVDNLEFMALRRSPSLLADGVHDPTWVRDQLLGYGRSANGSRAHRALSIQTTVEARVEHLHAVDDVEHDPCGGCADTRPDAGSPDTHRGTSQQVD